MDIQAFPLQNNKDANGFTIEPLEYGMTLRDYFAAKAMQADCTQNPDMQSEVTAIRAYEMADAMLKQRAK